MDPLLYAFGSDSEEEGDESSEREIKESDAGKNRLLKRPRGAPEQCSSEDDIGEETDGRRKQPKSA